MKKIYALLIMAMLVWGSAIAQWSTNADENTQITFGTGEDAIPKVGTQSDGNTFVSFWSTENGNYNVRLQMLDVTGKLLWEPNGLLVSDNTSDSWLTDWDMKVDQQDHCVMALQDIRSGDNDIYVYRISPDGTFDWGTDGICLSNTTTSFEPDPVIAIPDDGNPVFAWQSDISGSKTALRLQKVSVEGIKLWGEEGIIYQSEDEDNFIFPEIIVSDNNCVIVVFVKQGASFYDPRYMYAQKFDGNGIPVWEEPVPLLVTGSLPIVPYIVLESDATGGVFIAWFDDRVMNYFNCFVQHVDSQGNVTMIENGQEVSSISSTMRLYPSIAFNPSTEELFVFWREENTDQTMWGLYGQKMTPDGQRLWTDAGKIYIPVSGTDVDWVTARRADSIVIVMYHCYDLGSFYTNSIFAFSVDENGEYVWENPPVALSTVNTAKVHQEIGYYHDGQWITVWEDNRNGAVNIYGQNIKRDGSLGPISVGIEPEKQAFAGIVLGNPYPNPAKDRLYFTVSLDADEQVTIDLLDMNGKVINCIYTGLLSAGTHKLEWDCELSPAAGICCLRLKSEQTTCLKKILLAK